MVFYFGGYHQGMEEYAGAEGKSLYMLRESDTALPEGFDAYAGLDQFVLGCVKRGESALRYFQKNLDRLSSRTLIGTDLSCGIVPLDPVMRALRDENGRVNAYLAGEAETVTRFFCGLPQRLK